MSLPMTGNLKPLAYRDRSSGTSLLGVVASGLGVHGGVGTPHHGQLCCI